MDFLTTFLVVAVILTVVAAFIGAIFWILTLSIWFVCKALLIIGLVSLACATVGEMA